MITCLHQTRQSHIAEIFDKGGGLVRVHVALGGDGVEQTEEEIVTRFKSISKSSEQTIPLMTDFHIIAVERGLGVVLYFSCISLNDLVDLREMQNSGELKTVIKEMFRQLLSPVQFSEEVTAENLKDAVKSVFTLLLHHFQIANLTATLSENDYAKCRALYPADIKLRAVSDFDQRFMNIRERNELRDISQSKRQRRQKILCSNKQPVMRNQSGEDNAKDSDPTNAVVLSFEKGNKMETIPPANIGDNNAWWMVRHLDNGQVGFVPRNRVVIDFSTEEQPVTTLYDLPLEMLDIILQKSYLHRMVNLSENQRNEEVIRSLLSVDVCFNQRITRQWFKKATWRFLKDFYVVKKRRTAIILSNRNFLLSNIHPNDNFIASLLSFDCITQQQSHFIQRQRFRRDMNDELLYVMRSFDEIKFSNFVKCLRKDNQKTAARIIENGGGVIKTRVRILGALDARLEETRLLCQTVENLQNRTKPRSHQTDRIISLLRDEGIEILNSQLDRQNVVVWIWCRSQVALERMQRFYESNYLNEVLFEHIQPSTSKMISINRNQFKRTIVECPISINFTKSIQIRRNEYAFGVTELSDEIYVLCRSDSFAPNAIRIYEEQKSFRLRKEIEIKEIEFPWDLVSSEKENCLYVSDQWEKCIWRIRRESSSEHKTIKWLITSYWPYTLSVSSDGQLLVVDRSSSVLWIYESDAELIRSIQLRRQIQEPLHAVETFAGNFIIIHRWQENYDEVEEAVEEMDDIDGESGSSGTERVLKWVVSELTRDGQMVVRSFIPSNETQELNEPFYLSLDSDNRVLVADAKNGRVILLDSDLKWNRILAPTDEQDGETKLGDPHRICYSEDNKKLVVGIRIRGEGVYIYNMNRN